MRVTKSPYHYQFAFNLKMSDGEFYTRHVDKLAI